MTLEQNVIDALEAKRFSKDIEIIAITCVDPDYPLSHLHEYRDVDVSYDKRHVQQAPGMPQVSLVYKKDPDRLEAIRQCDVPDNLRYGVVQFAYHEPTKTLVMGIPGDAYAFNPFGKGFAYDNPDYAEPEVANAILKGVLEYSEGLEKIKIMNHSDCDLYAHNEGKLRIAPRNSAEDLRTDGYNFMNSIYEWFYERRDKNDGVKAIKDFTRRVAGHSEVKVEHFLAYVNEIRTPRIVEILGINNDSRLCFAPIATRFQL